MKTLLLSLAIVTAVPSVFSETVTFDLDAVAQQPAGWTCGTTGKGNPKWTVTAEPTAPSPPNVLKQEGAAPFPWCVKNDTSATDGSVEVKFKPISGKEDQAGGVVWRWKDGDNYYVARGNALEKNVSLYYTMDGSRKTIKYVKAPVALNTWHTLRVTYKANMIKVSLDGKTYIDMKDNHISGMGMAGVWTKADSVTLFDDFIYATTLPGRTVAN
jgi:hypothetical protein